MRKKTFLKRLKAQGWQNVDFSARQLLYCGNVELTLYKDENKSWCIAKNPDLVHKLSEIHELYFTPYRLIIDFGDYVEWYLKY